MARTISQQTKTISGVVRGVPFRLWDASFMTFGTNAGTLTTAFAKQQARDFQLMAPNTPGGSWMSQLTAMRAADANPNLLVLGYNLRGCIEANNSSNTLNNPDSPGTGSADPTWYAYDQSGTPASGSRQAHACMTDEWILRVWIAAIGPWAHSYWATQMAANDIDGALPDVCGPYPASHSLSSFGKHPYNERTNTTDATGSTVTFTDNEWVGGVSGWRGTKDIVRDIHAGATGQTALGGIGCAPNGIQDGPQYYAQNHLLMDGGGTTATNCGAAMVEDFLRSKDTALTSWPGYVESGTNSEWHDNVDMIADAERLSFPLLVLTKVWKSGQDVDPGLSQAKQWHRLSLGSFLLAANGWCFFSFRDDTPSVTHRTVTYPDGTTHSVDRLFQFRGNYYGAGQDWYAHVDRLGAAVEFHPTDSGTRRGAANLYKAATGLYRRAFENGVVYVNPTASAISVDLGAALYSDLDGSMLTGVQSLAARSAWVLVSEGAAPYARVTGQTIQTRVSSGTSVTATLPSAPSVGNLVVAWFTNSTTSAGSIHAPSGFTLLAQEIDTTANRSITLYGRVTVAGDSASATATVDAASALELGMAEFSGNPGTLAGIVDQSAGAHFGQAASAVTSDVSTSTAGDLVLGFFHLTGNTTFGNTWTNSFARLATPPATTRVEAGFRILSAGAVNLNTTESWSPNFGGASLIVALKAAPLLVSPVGVASAEALGSPVLSRPSAQTVSPSAIATSEALGTPALSRTLHATAVASAEVFGAASVLAGAASLFPAGISSTEAFGDAGVGITRLFAVAVSSAESFGTGLIRASLFPVGIGTAQAFGSPTMEPQQFVSFPGIPSAEAFGTVLLTKLPRYGIRAGFDLWYAGTDGYGTVLWGPIEGAALFLTLAPASTEATLIATTSPSLLAAPSIVLIPADLNEFAPMSLDQLLDAGLVSN